MMFESLRNDLYHMIMENQLLHEQIAKLSTTGTCRILSGKCDCTLCKQDTKIAELSGKVGELETQLTDATEERDALQSIIDEHAHRRHGESGMCCRLRSHVKAERDLLKQQLAAAEARYLDIVRAVWEAPPCEDDEHDHEETIAESHRCNRAAVQLAAAEARYVQIKAINDDNTKSFLDEMCKHTETLQRLAQAEARVNADESELARLLWHAEDQLEKTEERAEKAEALLDSMIVCPKCGYKPIGGVHEDV